MIVFLCIIGIVLFLVSIYIIVKDAVKNGFLEAYEIIDKSKVENQTIFK